MPSTLRFQAASWLFVVVLGISACAPSTETSPDTSEPPLGTTTTTTPVAQSTTSSTAPPGTATEARTEFGLLVVYEHSIVVRPTKGETYSVEGDFEVPLLFAYDDLNGGIIFQYARTSALLGEHIWQVSGTGVRKTVVSARNSRKLTLMDVGLHSGRPQVLYLDQPANGNDGQLYVAGISGGAPELVSDLPGIVTASMSDNAIAISQQVENCNSATIVNSQGEATGQYECAASITDVHLDPNGSEIAYLSGGQVRTEHLVDGPISTNWPQDLRSTTQVFDYSDDVAVVRDGITGFRLLDTNGASFSFRASKPIQWVSILHNEVSIGDGAFLGGLSEPTGSCSSLGLAAPPPAQADLPETVAAMRDAIVTAATSCGFDLLEQLAGPEFFYSFGEGSGDLSRFWQESDQHNFDTLAVIVRTFDLPFSVSIGPDSVTSYVWPAVAVIENPTEADWQELALVYNEEEIEFYKEFGFMGMRIFISEDGTWTGAIAGD